MTLTEYFVRRYALVVSNDQSTYRAAASAAVNVVRDSDITRREWLALPSEDRQVRFGSDIGDQIVALIVQLCDRESIDGSHIMREVLLLDDGIGRGLGCRYMPEDADVADLLADEDTGEATA